MRVQGFMTDTDNQKIDSCQIQPPATVWFYVYDDNANCKKTAARCQIQALAASSEQKES